MAQVLDANGKLDGDRQTRFPQKYLNCVEQLIRMIASEIAEKHIMVLMRTLNRFLS